MKKLTKEQIEKAFKKVTDQNFQYGEETNLITLHGTFCSDELRCIANVIDDISKGSREVNRIQKLDIKGIKAKDIKVTYFRMFNSWQYSFYVMKDGKDYDFYYGKSDDHAGDWWPEPEEDMYESPLTQFIPEGFAKSCENSYSYDGPQKEALSLLEECGFTVEKGNVLNY